MITGLKTIEIISPKIYHLIFDTTFNLCNVLVRFQEYHECPKFKGKNFKRKQFFDWFKKTYDTNYTDAWDGFNFPSKVFDAEMFMSYKHMSKDEKTLVNMFKSLNLNNFYIIGSSMETSQSKNTKKHELSHALYYIDKEYKTGVNKIVKSIDSKLFNLMKFNLFRLGYCKDVIFDEIGAYLLTDAEAICNEKQYVPTSHINELENLYQKTLKNIL